jgi:UDP-glucuronate 4-epimerase
MMMILNILSITMLGITIGRLSYAPPYNSTTTDIRSSATTTALIASVSSSTSKPAHLVNNDENETTNDVDVISSKRKQKKNLRIAVIGAGKGFEISTLGRIKQQQQQQQTIISDQDYQPEQSEVMLVNPQHPQETYRLRVPRAVTVQDMDHLRGPDGPKYNVLVTGAAGFVGMHTSIELARLGSIPIGYDNVNSYYNTDLKESRIDQLYKHNITFVKGDVCDVEQLAGTIQRYNITRVIHLAAQAGVRYSLDHPLEYTHNNIDCTVKLFEVMVKLGITEKPLVYASSSSVYGNNVKVPFRESDPVEDPASLYATTKRTNELLARTYYNLYNLTSIGLRFFTVYGPYGRPDMAPWIFTDMIMNNKTIPVFNNGKSQRDFTYIDDIVQGVVNALLIDGTGQPEIVNLGNGKPIVLADFVHVVEENVGTVAMKNHMPMQQGDVPVTFADITKARYLLGYNPSTTIEIGISKFVAWFQRNHAWRYRMTATATTPTNP